MPSQPWGRNTLHEIPSQRWSTGHQMTRVTLFWEKGNPWQTTRNELGQSRRHWEKQIDSRQQAKQAKLYSDPIDTCSRPASHACGQKTDVLVAPREALILHGLYIGVSETLWPAAPAAVLISPRPTELCSPVHAFPAYHDHQQEHFTQSVGCFPPKNTAALSSVVRPAQFCVLCNADCSILSCLLLHQCWKLTTIMITVATV